MRRTMAGIAARSTFLCILLLAPQAVHAQGCEHQLIAASGQAPIISDLLSARDEAERDALRRAVEIGGGVVIDSAILVEYSQLVTDEIVTRTAGYVSSHTITQHGPDAENAVYTVEIEACVEPDIPENLVRDLQTDLETLGYVVKRQLGNPRLVIQAEAADDPLVSSQVENTLMEHFGGLGFSINSRSSTDCGSLADEVDTSVADVIVCATANVTSQPVAAAEGMVSAAASVRLQAFLVSNRQQIALVTNTSSRHPSTIPDRAASEALREALVPKLDEFTFRLVGGLNASIEGQTAISVEVRDLPDVATFRRVIAFVASIRGVEHVQDRGLVDGRGTFDVQGTAAVADIVARIEAAEAQLGVHVDGYSGFSIGARWEQ